MDKKEYLGKIENLIVNRIKYHAPNLISSDVDFSLLDAIGIDGTKPIFVYKKPLDKLFYFSFILFCIRGLNLFSFLLILFFFLFFFLLLSSNVRVPHSVVLSF